MLNIDLIMFWKVMAFTIIIALISTLVVLMRKPRSYDVAAIIYIIFYLCLIICLSTWSITFLIQGNIKKNGSGEWVQSASTTEP